MFGTASAIVVSEADAVEFTTGFRIPVRCRCLRRER